MALLHCCYKSPVRYPMWVRMVEGMYRLQVSVRILHTEKAKQCSSLPNCDIGQRRCNSNTDQRCLKCKDDFGEDMQAYALLPRHQSAYPNIVQDGVCQPRCSWISNSTLCYPGECHPEGPPSTCNCTTGFSGVGCLAIDNDPEPLECWAKVIRMVDGNKIDWKEAECVTSQNETVYVNDEGINHIEVAWTTFFRGAESYPSRPVYVNDFKVGVLGSWSVYRIYSDSINSNSTNGTMSITRFCDSLVNASEANPSVGTPIDCLATEKTHYEFKDSDILQIDTTIVNGGYVETSGYPDPDELQRYSYKGNTLTNTVTFTFDFEAPYHCSLQTSCHENLLDRSLPFTKQENLSISWSGWEDEVSYVHHYEINVLPSQSNNGYLKCSEDRATAEKCDVYAPMSIVQLGFKIQIQVKWTRHFANEFHKNADLLNAIDDYSLNVLPAYDELTGQPPHTRSREAIPNVHGIIKFEVAIGVDQQGGESLTGAPEWFDVNDVEAEEVEIAISHQDGDTIRIWIKGQDAMENIIEDNVTVHSDSTPPEIGEMYLTRSGVEYLAVHNSEDLHEMRVIFDAFDDHSGLSVVHWELFDMNNNSLIHGEGSLPVVRAPELNDCNPPECTCIPLGECYYRNFTIEMNKELMTIPIGTHGYDYVFSVTVTNNAMLQRTRQFQITVDNSPPHDGSVHDSLPDYQDVDYQHGTQIFASWDGFFDRESGIMLYVYYFGTDCLHDTDITFPIEAPLLTTTSTQAEWTVPLPDRYHCTVIAYNRAMQPSNPVCSDGVTVDASEPIITDVVVDDIYIKAGLVQDGNGTVWFISENRERQRVLNASEACM
ncbi:uncharacterized protein [Ptychodera flava]|uniref:uncharacterized protein n=1 Tax=Ptychodera flava TaxID=63121 RepID=UPI003969D01D